MFKNVSKLLITRIIILILVLLLTLLIVLLINFSKDVVEDDFEDFCNTIKVVQDKVIKIYDNDEQLIGVNLSNSDDKNKYEKAINDIKVEYGVDILSENYYYLNTENKQKLGLGDLKDNYIVNYITSEVYNLNPVKYEGKLYYTNLSIDNSLKGVAKYNDPPIPQGFRHVEGTWDTGLVIRDSYGNEFVWVPVGMLNETNPVSALKKYYKEYPSDTKQTNEYMQIINSLEKYQGFYIARYEASLQGATQTSSQGINNTLQIVKNVLPVSKVSFSTNVENNTGVVGYNEVGNMSSSGEIKGALEMATSMASDYGWDKNGIGTGLMYTEQFDTLLKIIENKGLLKDKTNEKANPLTEDAVLWGNYMNSKIKYKIGEEIIDKDENEGRLIPTGAAIYDNNEVYNRNCVFNIYDLAGNLSEWSMEEVLNKYMSVRGGNYTMRSTFSTVTAYERITPETSSSTIGIRVVMYII